MDPFAPYLDPAFQVPVLFADGDPFFTVANVDEPDLSQMPITDWDDFLALATNLVTPSEDAGALTSNTSTSLNVAGSENFGDGLVSSAPADVSVIGTLLDNAAPVSLRATESEPLLFGQDFDFEFDFNALQPWDYSTALYSKDDPTLGYEPLDLDQLAEYTAGASRPMSTLETAYGMMNSVGEATAQPFVPLTQSQVSGNTTVAITPMIQPQVIDLTTPPPEEAAVPPVVPFRPAPRAEMGRYIPKRKYGPRRPKGLSSESISPTKSASEQRPGKKGMQRRDSVSGISYTSALNSHKRDCPDFGECKHDCLFFMHYNPAWHLKHAKQHKIKFQGQELVVNGLWEHVFKDRKVRGKKAAPR